MPAHQLSMDNIKLVLAFHHEAEASNRAIARHLGISRSSVARTLQRAKAGNVPWPLPEDLADADLRRALYPNAETRSTQQHR